MALKDDLIRGAQIASNPFRRQWLALTRANNPGPKVLANSIPKSGTHLLMRCLDLFPGMVNYHSGLFIFGLGQTGLAGKQNALRRMGGGCHVMAHLPYAPEAGQTLAGYGFKTVLMVRDPRDVAVSLYKFALRKRRHPLRPYFASLPDDHTRLKMAIIGNLDVAYGGIGPRFRSYMPWAEHGSFLLTFEDLVGEKGGGSNQRQQQTIHQLAEHIGLSLTPAQRNDVAANLFDPHSRTFRKGVIGDWRNQFTPEHKAIFKEYAGDVLIALGYEQDMNW